MLAVRRSCDVCGTRLASALRRDGNGRRRPRRIRSRRYARHRLVRYRLTGGWRRRRRSPGAAKGPERLLGAQRGWLLFTRGHVVDRAGGPWTDLARVAAAFGLRLAHGAIMFGSLMALMLGGSVGETEPANMFRWPTAQAEPTRARPNIAMTKVRLCRRTRGTSLS